MGEAGEAMNISHQQKRWTRGSAPLPRPLLALPVPDDQLEALPTWFAEEAPEHSTRSKHRMAWAASRRSAGAKAAPPRDPPGSTFAALLGPGEGRELSTTMAVVRIMNMRCATSRSASMSCRSSRTKRAPSAWRACSASTASGTSGPELRAGRPRPADVLQEKQDRPGAAGRHQRGRAAMATGSPRPPLRQPTCR